MEYEIRRSKRRKRNVVAYLEHGRVIVVAPAHLSKAQADDAAIELVARLSARVAAAESQDALAARAKSVADTYFPEDLYAAGPISVKWVTNQNTRWGSCTRETRTIRLSHRLQGMPQWVIDCVILHELAHLLEFDHGPRFTALINRHPDYARSRDYLAGFEMGAQWARTPKSTEEESN